MDEDEDYFTSDDMVDILAGLLQTMYDEFSCDDPKCELCRHVEDVLEYVNHSAIN